MDYPFIVPGYEHISLSLRTHLFSGPTILYAGEPLKKIPNRKYVLTLSDGSDLTLGLKHGGFDLVPRVTYNDQVIQVAPKLPVYQQVLINAPFILIFIGGAVGGICGALAAVVNAKIFRADYPVAVKVTLSVVVSFAAALFWFCVAVVLNLAIHHYRK